MSSRSRCLLKVRTATFVMISSVRSSVELTAESAEVENGVRGLRLSVRVFFNTSSGCPRLPDECCRPVWTNPPPPSGEDGYCTSIYPASRGTASSHFSELARGTHTHRESSGEALEGSYCNPSPPPRPSATVPGWLTVRNLSMRPYLRKAGSDQANHMAV